MGSQRLRKHTEKWLLGILGTVLQLVRLGYFSVAKICLQWFNMGPKREKNSRAGMVQTHTSH